MPLSNGVGNISGVYDETRDMIVKTSLFIENLPAQATYNTAGAVTYLATDFLGGVIVRNCNGAARTDVLPTMASIGALLQSAGMNIGNSLRIGDTIYCLIINGSAISGGTQVITLSLGSGMSFDTNQDATSTVIATSSSKTIGLRFTNVTPGAYAATIFS